jgi:hypothetical protein
MLVATYNEVSGTKIHNRLAGKHRWLVKAEFTAKLEDGREVMERNSLIVKVPCHLSEVLPSASESIKGMLTDIEHEVVLCEGKFEVWKL